MILLTLLLIPTFIAFGAFLWAGKKITLQEFGVQLVAQCAIVGLAYGAMLYTNMADTEVWNGRVSYKTHETVSCEHSYTCNCVTVSCGKDCTTTICQTCHEHSYDVDWPLYTTNQERIRIRRIDRQGLNEPSRWSAAQVGDTTSLAHGYKNYIKAAPNSLFRKVGLVEKYKDQLPPYPQNIYDYHYLDRLVLVGLDLSDSVLWNKDLRELNADLGRQKESNVIVVVTKNKPDDYFYALEQHWIGGKKNDIVVVLDVNDEGKINWTQTMAWTDAEIFKINMRDSLLSLKKLDRELILPTIQAVVLKDYKRKSMKDFEYLTQSIAPTKNEYLGLTILGILVSLGISWFLWTNDIEDEESSNIYRRYR